MKKAVLVIVLSFLTLNVIAMDNASDGEDAYIIVKEETHEFIIPGSELINFIAQDLGVNLLTMLKDADSTINFKELKTLLNEKITEFYGDLPNETLKTLDGTLRFIGLGHHKKTGLAQRMSTLSLEKKPQEDTIKLKTSFTIQKCKGILTKLCNILCTELESLSRNKTSHNQLLSFDILIKYNLNTKTLTLKCVPAQSGHKRSVMPLLTLMATSLTTVSTSMEQASSILTEQLPESAKKNPCVIKLKTYIGYGLVILTLALMIVQLAVNIENYIHPTPRSSSNATFECYTNGSRMTCIPQ